MDDHSEYGEWDYEHWYWANIKKQGKCLKCNGTGNIKEVRYTSEGNFSGMGEFEPEKYTERVDCPRCNGKKVCPETYSDFHMKIAWFDSRSIEKWPTQEDVQRAMPSTTMAVTVVIEDQLLSNEVLKIEAPPLLADNVKDAIYEHFEDPQEAREFMFDMVFNYLPQIEIKPPKTLDPYIPEHLCDKFKRFDIYFGLQ